MRVILFKYTNFCINHWLTFEGHFIWIFEYLNICAHHCPNLLLLFSKVQCFYFLDQAGPASIDFWLITCYVIPTSPLPTIRTRLSQLIWVFRKVWWAPLHRWRPVEGSREGNCWENVNPQLSLTCHMSHAMCSVSVVMCNVFLFCFLQMKCCW